MVLNISSVKDFARCRLRWLYTWYYGRVPRRGSRPLELGKLIHVVFENHFKGMTMEEAFDAAVAELKGTAFGSPMEHDSAMEALTDLMALREPLLQWTDQYPITETLEVEEPFEYPHPDETGLIVRGRPDRVVLCYGKVFHVQNRSLAAGKKIGLYLELRKTDLHELVYGWALAQKYPKYPYGGTIFNLVRKLRWRGVPTKAFPGGKVLRKLDEVLVQAAMPVVPEQQALALMDLGQIGREMQRTILEAEDGVFPARNREYDGGPFDNSPDPYLPVFMGQADLWDDRLYKDREDPYGPKLP